MVNGHEAVFLRIAELRRDAAAEQRARDAAGRLRGRTAPAPGGQGHTAAAGDGDRGPSAGGGGDDPDERPDADPPGTWTRAA